VSRLILDSANMDHIGSSEAGRAGQHTLKVNRTSPQGVMNRRPPPYLGGNYGHFSFSTFVPLPIQASARQSSWARASLPRGGALGKIFMGPSRGKRS